MKGLQTARVIVVDDSTDDAHAILGAFSRAGVGALSFSGEKAGLPANRELTGIRLAAVDLDLTGIYGLQDDDRVLDPTLQVLKAIVSPDNGPYLAIAWTANPGMIDLFEQRAKNLPCPPLDVVGIDKSDVKVDGEFDVGAILERVKPALANAYPLEVLGLWEQLVHDAASETVRVTTQSLAGTADGGMSILAAILKEACHDLDDPGVSLRALFEGLNPLHFDAVEARTAQEYTAETDLIQRLATAAKTATPSNIKANLNRRLMVGAPLAEPAPGNVYLLEGVRRLIGEQREIIPTKATLYKEMLREGILNVEEDDFGANKPKPVLIEITPLCDFQNGNMKVAKLLAGLAVPIQDLSSKKRKRFQKASSVSLRLMPVINFNARWLSGEQVLAFFAPYTITVSKQSLSAYGALFRLREAPLIDLQAWASGHAGRPGFLSIT